MLSIGLEAAVNRNARQAVVVAHVEQVVDGDLLVTVADVPVNPDGVPSRILTETTLRLTPADRDALITALTKGQP